MRIGDEHVIVTVCKTYVCKIIGFKDGFYIAETDDGYEVWGRIRIEKNFGELKASKY